MCPFCQNPKAHLKKKGFYTKKSTRTSQVQRYFCGDCRRSFSDQTNTLSYRDKKPHINQFIYRWICSGVSQARIARNFGIERQTVSRKITKLARFARRDHQEWMHRQSKCPEVQFDEMESFEHSKCKPLSLALAVRPDTREIIGMVCASMPAKGKLAARSRKKYGPRKDKRPYAMRTLFEGIRTTYKTVDVLSSDKKTTYGKYCRDYFPDAQHKVTKGRRGCVVGQGELKAGGFDPLFKLNHTAAMFRDNIKTLARRTWCTVKISCRFQDLLDLYTHWHNLAVCEKIRTPSICRDPIM